MTTSTNLVNILAVLQPYRLVIRLNKMNFSIFTISPLYFFMASIDRFGGMKWMEILTCVSGDGDRDGGQHYL